MGKKAKGAGLWNSAPEPAGSLLKSVKNLIVEEIFALDLSKKFLTTTGLRVFNHFGGDESKLRFLVSDFNDIPLESQSVDCVLLFACLHHSLAPIKTLQEAYRLLKPGGNIVVLEQPHATLRIRQARKNFLALSEQVTEIAYTRGELRLPI